MDAPRSSASSLFLGLVVNIQFAILFHRCLRNFNKLVQLQACAAHQRAIDVWLSEKFRRVGASYGTAIKYPNGLGGRCAVHFCQRLSNVIAYHRIGIHPLEARPVPMAQTGS